MTVNYPARKRKHDNPGGKTRDVNAANRVRMALQLRAQRLPWEEVAARAGYSSKGAAHNAVMRELQRTISGDVEVWLNEELASLDYAEAEIWPLFLDKKNRGRLFAWDRILAIKERRAKLKGLDARSDDVVGPQIIIQEVPAGYLEGPKE